MNILIGTLVLALLAAWIWHKLGGEDNRRAALVGVRRMAVNNTPRIMVALISAGLFAELLPDDLVRAYLGDTAGLSGVILGTVLGVFTPGGAFVSFALAAGAAQAGAATPALVAYVCAWALFSLTKMIAEEFVFLGPRFILTRVALTFPLPVLVGGLALWL